MKDGLPFSNLLLPIWKRCPTLPRVLGAVGELKQRTFQNCSIEICLARTKAARFSWGSWIKDPRAVQGSRFKICPGVLSHNLGSKTSGRFKIQDFAGVRQSWIKPTVLMIQDFAGASCQNLESLTKYSIKDAAPTGKPWLIISPKAKLDPKPVHRLKSQ